MSTRVQIGQLQVAEELHRFIEDEALPGSGVESAHFWATAASLFRQLSARNRELLAVRDELQAHLDDYHRAHPGPITDEAAYTAMLREIGYLVPPPPDFTISTTGVDAEITRQPGPQLVVPLLNARFAVNAANARWGSLYDALYGTDAIARTAELAPGDSYNPERGAHVVARGRELLDEFCPLGSGSHADATGYRIEGPDLVVEFGDGTSSGLATASHFAGYRLSEGTELAGVLLVHHGLHIEIVIDRQQPIGRNDRAGVNDIVLESALTTILDLEDSVAAVDAPDKVLGYRNWLGLMQGTLSAGVTKNGASFERTMAADRTYTAPDGSSVVLPGRALLFLRHVGHLMTTDAILDGDGNEVGEGILDALVTTLAGLHDLRAGSGLRNSRTGSMYFVKPKMHGPDEVEFAVDLLSRLEQAFGLPHATLKIGLMDEERRTSVNLKACIHRARDRIAFINTGFLDRTGDEIHTSMQGAPTVRKAAMRHQQFLEAYEINNVDEGLAAGFSGVAQIGKGMWAMPDLMADMLDKKQAQLQAGAATAWVPSPTAATLHAIHYHQIDVLATQRELRERAPIGIGPILRPPLAAQSDVTPAQRREELDDNVQSILGYVVRWVDQGIGCSKVPDIHDVAMMEDRATLRISSQLLANWLLHEVITVADVRDSLTRVSLIVDRQNEADPNYEPLAVGEQSLAFCAARDLILLGAEQPSGYTEPILHRYRRAKKGTNTP